MVGQLVHMRSALDRVTRRAGAAEWPEYAELDCFACHHNLTRPEDSWRQNLGFPQRKPGSAPLNVARWMTARHVLEAHDARAAADLKEIMNGLERETSRPRANTGEIVALGNRARTLLDSAIARAVASKPDAALASRLFRAIAADVENIAPRGERAAEQAAMALETLHLAFAPMAEGGPVRAAFDELFQQFQNPSAYDPRRFIAQVKKIEAAVGK
jgi:hypothetical protein